MKVLPRVLESCLEEEEVAPELRVTCSAEPFAPGLAKSWWQNLRGWECFGSKSKWGSACAQISGCVNLLSPCVLQTFSIHLPTYLFQWFGILRMEMLLGLIVEWWACSLTTVLLLKAFISKWSNFNCVWEKKKLTGKAKKVRKLSDKGVTRAVTGSTGSSLCFMFCLLHSQQGSGPCFDEWFHCRQGDYSQNQLSPICGYRYLHMTFIQNVSVLRHSAVLWGRLQCWCCFSMSFVGISTTSFCQHLLCAFGFIYMKLNIAFRHRHLAVEQELGLPLCLFSESLEFSRLQWSHQVLVQAGVWQPKAEILCSQTFWRSALFLCRRPPHLLTTRAGSAFLRRDQVPEIRRRPPGVDYWHRREGQPHGQDHRQAPDHWSGTTGGHSERQPHARCHLLIEMK